MYSYDAFDAFGAIFLGVAGVGLLICVLQIAATWKIFTKAGEAGWKSLIPVYSQYVQYERFWSTKYFWISMILGVISGCISPFAESGEATVMVSILAVIAGVCAFILEVMFMINLSRHFGYDSAFAIGLILLPFVFLLILAFGSAEYIEDADEVNIPFIEDRF